MAKCLQNSFLAELLQTIRGLNKNNRTAEYKALDFLAYNLKANL